MADGAARTRHDRHFCHRFRQDARVPPAGHDPHQRTGGLSLDSAVVFRESHDLGALRSIRRPHRLERRLRPRDSLPTRRCCPVSWRRGAGFVPRHRRLSGNAHNGRRSTSKPQSKSPHPVTTALVFVITGAAGGSGTAWRDFSHGRALSAVNCARFRWVVSSSLDGGCFRGSHPLALHACPFCLRCCPPAASALRD